MAATICLRPWPWLLTLKSVWESHVTWGTPVQSFVFLGLLVFELELMYATSDRRTTDADHCLMPPGGGIIKQVHYTMVWSDLHECKPIHTRHFIMLASKHRAVHIYFILEKRTARYVKHKTSHLQIKRIQEYVELNWGEVAMNSDIT